jgi:hypothetical protein
MPEESKEMQNLWKSIKLGQKQVWFMLTPFSRIKEKWKNLNVHFVTNK